MSRDDGARIEIHPLLEARHSPRTFADRDLTDDTVERLFEAARWSPSCFNEQPWAFVIATRDQEESYAQLLSLLVERNQAWARGASLLVIAVAREHFQRNGKPNAYAWYDVGQALAHLTVQAQSEGIAVHQMAGFDRDRAREVLGIPEGWVATSAAAVGYYADPGDLPEEEAARLRGGRSRKARAELLFRGRFAQAEG